MLSKAHHKPWPASLVELAVLLHEGLFLPWCVVLLKEKLFVPFFNALFRILQLLNHSGQTRLLWFELLLNRRFIQPCKALYSKKYQCFLPKWR